MFPLALLSAVLPLLASSVNGAAVEQVSRRNETAVNPGGPVTNVTSTTAASSAAIVPTLSSSGSASASASNSSSVNPGGAITNVTSSATTSSNAALASATTLLGTNSTSSEYVACVSDSSIASLVETQGFNATDREACSNACISEGTQQIAYFDDADNLCYCVEGDDAPTSDEVVYAVDKDGNCRSKDDASVELLYAPYPLAGCDFQVNTTLATSNFTDTYAEECFYGCTRADVDNPETNATQTVAIRPQLNAVTKAFEYQCLCFPEIVDGYLSTDCGFGVYAIYHD